MSQKRDQIASLNRARSGRRPLAAIAAALSPALILAALTVAASVSAGATGESRASTQTAGPRQHARLRQPRHAPPRAQRRCRANGALGPQPRRRPRVHAEVFAMSTPAPPGHGFLRDARGFTTIDAPSAYGSRLPPARDERGRVAGTYRDARRRSHGFLRSKRGFRQIDFPGAEGTVVRKTSARGKDGRDLHRRARHGRPVLRARFPAGQAWLQEDRHPRRLADAAVRDQQSWADRGRVPRSRRHPSRFPAR